MNSGYTYSQPMQTHPFGCSVCGHDEYVENGGDGSSIIYALCASCNTDHLRTNGVWDIAFKKTHVVVPGCEYKYITDTNSLGEKVTFRYIWKLTIEISDKYGTDRHVIYPPKPPKLADIEGNWLKREDQHWRRPELIEYWKPEWLNKVAERFPLKAKGRTMMGYDAEWYKKPEKFGTLPVEIQNDMIEFADREWQRRMEGFWFMNDGEAVYVPRMLYVFLTYFRMEGDQPYADFRYNQWKLEMFWQFCIFNDPYCLGSIELKLRRGGYTNLSLNRGLVIGSETESANIGLQSHAGDAAEEEFSRAVFGYNSWPAFYHPMRSGILVSANEILWRAPDERLTKYTSLKRGKDGSLNSKFNYKDTTEKAYDNMKLAYITNDEGGKHDKMNFARQMEVLMRCLHQGSTRVGFISCPSTVAELTKAGGEKYREMWKRSAFSTILNPKIIATASKLKRFFLSCYEQMEGWFDKYGRAVINPPDEETALWLQQKDKVANKGIEKPIEHFRRGARIAHSEEYEQLLRENSDAAIQFLRMFPRNPDDAFVSEGKANPYNMVLLSNRQGELQSTMERELPFGIFSLKFRNGITPMDYYYARKHGRVVDFPIVDYVPDPNGLWYIAFDDYIKQRLNKVMMRGGSDFSTYFSPMNANDFFLGGDPNRYSGASKTSAMNAKASQTAIYGFWGHNEVIDPPLIKPISEWRSHNFFLEYLHRQNDTQKLAMDFAMVCWLFGCKILPEINVPIVTDAFKLMGMWNFIQQTPTDYTDKNNKTTVTTAAEESKGYYSGSDGHGNSRAEIWIAENASFIENHAGRMKFPRQVKACIDFDTTEITKHDANVGMGMAMLNYKQQQARFRKTERRDVNPELLRLASRLN